MVFEYLYSDLSVFMQYLWNGELQLPPFSSSQIDEFRNALLGS